MTKELELELYARIETLEKEVKALRSAKLSKDMYCDQIEKEMGREIRDLKQENDKIKKIRTVE